MQLDQVLSTLKSGTRADLKLLLHGLWHGPRRRARGLHRVIPLMEPAFLRTAVGAQACRASTPATCPASSRQRREGAAALDVAAQQLPRLVTASTARSRRWPQRRQALGASVTRARRVVGHAPAAFTALDNLFPTARAFVREARPGIRELPATLRLGNPVLDQAARLIAPVSCRR